MTPEHNYRTNVQDLRSKTTICLPNRVILELSRNFYYIDMQIMHIYESVPVSSTESFS